MFSRKHQTDLKAEITGLIDRYFPDCHPCYRGALFKFLFSACLMFDRYQDIFSPAGRKCNEEPACPAGDRQDEIFSETLAGLLDSPLLEHKELADPDPRPKPPKRTGRHREPPPPPSL